MKRRKIKKMLALEQFNAKQITDGLAHAAEAELQRMLKEAADREEAKAAALKAVDEAVAINNEQEILAKLNKPKVAAKKKEEVSVPVPTTEEKKTDEQA